jgi:hypothetical protein
MRHGDCSHQRQAKARATGATCHERLEETRQHLRGYPTSSIAHLEEQMRVVCMCGDAHHPAV